MPPPLPSAGELGYRLGGKAAVHSLDVFIDLACPFSKKIFNKLVEVFAWAEEYKPGSFSVRFLLTPQPWHPQSGVLAEAVLAVQAIDPNQTVPFTKGYSRPFSVYLPLYKISVYYINSFIYQALGCCGG